MSRLYLAVVLFIVPATLRAQEAFTPLDSGLTVGETIHVLVDAPCATKACPGELVKGKVRNCRTLRSLSMTGENGASWRRRMFAILNGRRIGSGTAFSRALLSASPSGSEASCSTAASASHASSILPRLLRRQGLSAAVSVRASAPSPMP